MLQAPGLTEETAMPLLGKAAIAMWWDMPLPQREEFEHWHSHEHFPERMRIPGFLRGSRWMDPDVSRYFVLYELDAYETLTSPRYVERLNDPTPWSIRMMPHHLNMVRSQALIVATAGGGIAGSIMTLRLSPKPGQNQPLQDFLVEFLARLPVQPGVTGAHLLQTRTPEAAITEEQRIRGADATAEWIVLLCGYDAKALEDLNRNELSASRLTAAGALDACQANSYRLSFAATPGTSDTRRPKNQTQETARSLEEYSMDFVRSFVASSAILVAAGAAAQSAQEHTIRFGHLVQPGHPISLGVKRFGEILAEKSGGRMHLRSWAAAAVGGEQQQLSAVQGGIQDITMPSATIMGGVVKEFTLLDMPFTFSKAEQVDALLNGPFGQKLQSNASGEGPGGTRLLGDGVSQLHQQPQGRSSTPRTSKV